MRNMIPAWMGGTLQKVEKLEVHWRDLRHKAVSVFGADGGHILLQQRNLGKYHSPGLWANTCCTHPKWHEAPDDCARRRLQEELGIAGLTVVPVGPVEYRADVGQGLVEHEVVDEFLAPASFRPLLRPDPAEVADTCWMTLAELDAAMLAEPQRFTPWLHVYLTQHPSAHFWRRCKIAPPLSPVVRCPVCASPVAPPWHLWQDEAATHQSRDKLNERIRHPPRDDGRHPGPPVGCDQVPDHRRDAGRAARKLSARGAARGGLCRAEHRDR